MAYRALSQEERVSILYLNVLLIKIVLQIYYIAMNNKINRYIYI